MNDEPALALRGIRKRFGTALALEGAELQVRRGTIHALLGENGAGKTTLMRIAYGLIRPDAGGTAGAASETSSIRVAGREVELRSPADAIALGIGMVHQHYTNVPAMTVVENIALGQRGRFGATRSAGAVRDLGARVGLPVDPEAIVGELSMSAQQRLEILKAIARDATILILDEPTAVLAPAESEDLLRWLRGFADRGGAVVLITHKLTEAATWADDVTVLRAGRTVLASPRSATSIDAIAVAMLGASPVSVPAPEQGDAAGRGATVARAMNLTIHDERGVVKIADASFELRAGEIVGIVGVDGSGHAELLRAIAGRIEVSKGSLTRPASIAFVPEDRHRDALILDFTLTENVALTGAGARAGRMGWGRLSRRTASLLTSYDVRGGAPSTKARALSGGNQQKLVLARELEGASDGGQELVVAENPTRGLDVRAAAAIHQRLKDACGAGAAVVIYSSDLDEVIELATRVLVVYAGRVSEMEPDRAAVGVAMLGTGSV